MPQLQLDAVTFRYERGCISVQAEMLSDTGCMWSRPYLPSSTAFLPSTRLRLWRVAHSHSCLFLLWSDIGISLARLQHSLHYHPICRDVLQPSCFGCCTSPHIFGYLDNVALRTTKGTDEYENPLHAETSFSGAEVSHTRPMEFYRTYSACDFGAVSGERCRAVGGSSD